jgi:hypothetical protein
MKLYIYKLHAINEEIDSICYVGSTINPRGRFSMHKVAFNRWVYEGKGYFCSSFKVFEKYGTTGVTFSILEEIECESRMENKMIEYDWMYRVNNAVNISRGQTLIDIQKYNREYKQNLGRCMCDCGADILVNSKGMHKKTLKHRKYLADLQNVYS